MENIFVYVIQLPPKINECVTTNEDGSHSIFINDMLSRSGRMAAYNHAMRHIRGNDFEKGNADTIEGECHA